MHALPTDTGWIEIICGPMYSGKTEELIRRLRRALYARQKVQIFKPHIDKRYDEGAIVSHSRQQLEAHSVGDAREVLAALHPATAVVAIDEGQFFGANLVEVAQACANRGHRVLIAGLDQDFTGAPFEPMPALLAVAEFVTKMLAICVVCGNPAGRSQRLSGQSKLVLVGGPSAYEARCRRCHRPQPNLPQQGPLFAPVTDSAPPGAVAAPPAGPQGSG